MYKDEPEKLNLLTFNELIDEPTYTYYDVYPGYGGEGWAIFELWEKAKLEDINVYFSDHRLLVERIECIWKLEK